MKDSPAPYHRKTVFSPVPDELLSGTGATGYDKQFPLRAAVGCAVLGTIVALNSFLAGSVLALAQHQVGKSGQNLTVFAVDFGGLAFMAIASLCWFTTFVVRQARE